MIPGLPPLKVLESQTLTGSATSVRLPASGTISATGNRHIVVLVNGRTDRALANDDVRFQYNGDTGSNYATQGLYGLGGTPVAWNVSGHTRTYGISISGNSAPANASGGGALVIPHAFGDTFKTSLGYGGSHEYISVATANYWASTAAITYITATPDVGTNFLAGSVFTLCVVDEAYLVEEDILTGDQAGFNFTSLPTPDYGSLSLIANLRAAGSYGDNNTLITFNGDETSSNYRMQRLLGLGSSIAASSTNISNSAAHPGATATANTFSGLIASVNQYDLPADDPTMHVLNGHQDGSVLWIGANRWNNPTEITSVKLISNGGDSYVAGSMLSVYSTPKILLNRQVVAGAAASSITFTLSGYTIPDSVEHLRVHVYAQKNASSSADIYVEFNSDTTAANYDYSRMYGVSTTASGDSNAALGRFLGMPGTDIAEKFGGGTALIANYANTTFHKHWTFIDGNGSEYVVAGSGRWENTAAIATIKLTPQAGSFSIGSVFELEGIGNLWPETFNGIEKPGKVNGVERINIESVSKPTPFSASGGTETTYTSVYGIDYKVHTFTSSGTLTVLGGEARTADFLVVAGGASNSSYGGGGAGGFRTSSGTSGANSVAESQVTLSGQAYSIVVGAGGAVAGGSSRETDAGSDSVALGITSVGGGVGVGGSGGGSTDHSGSGSAGTANQGMAGGDGNGGGPYSGGGGGGAGAVGQDASSADAGNGGAGLANSLRTGSGVDYAGGGGGGTYAPNGANQGGTASHGGGAGGAHQGAGAGTNFYAGVAGTVNTGGGGGCVDAGMVYGEGNNGGSGIVVIRYKV